MLNKYISCMYVYTFYVQTAKQSLIPFIDIWEMNSNICDPFETNFSNNDVSRYFHSMIICSHCKFRESTVYIDVKLAYFHRYIELKYLEMWENFFEKTCLTPITKHLDKETVNVSNLRYGFHMFLGPSSRCS